MSARQAVLLVSSAPRCRVTSQYPWRYLFIYLLFSCFFVSFISTCFRNYLYIKTRSLFRIDIEFPPSSHAFQHLSISSQKTGLYTRVCLRSRVASTHKGDIQKSQDIFSRLAIYLRCVDRVISECNHLLYCIVNLAGYGMSCQS